MRNCVAVGANPNRIAILDNFCWGTTDRPETLGSLVRAALACYDVATVLGTPFISGKDSLNNEFRPLDAKEPISIPPSLLISALGQVDDVSHCVSMDLKEPGNLLYIVGLTKDELGGSHFAMVEGLSGGEVPKVDAQVAKNTLRRIAQGDLRGLGACVSRPFRGRIGGGRRRNGLCRRVGGQNFAGQRACSPRRLGEGPGVRAAELSRPRPLVQRIEHAIPLRSPARAKPPHSRPRWPAFRMPASAKLSTTASWRFAAKRRSYKPI